MFIQCGYVRLTAFVVRIQLKLCVAIDVNSFVCCLAESAPLHIRGLTPGFVQAAIDHLNTSDFYTSKLLCGRYEPPEGEQPGTSEPAHETRSGEKKKPDLIEQAMGFSSDIRGKMPKPFSSKAEVEAEASRGAAKDFSLSNTHQLAMLTNYLYLNGKYDLCSTPKDGSCLFSAFQVGSRFPSGICKLIVQEGLGLFHSRKYRFLSPRNGRPHQRLLWWHQTLKGRV